MSAAPYLDCPECGADVFQAKHRGRYDADDNYVEHKDSCRCRWCSWRWFDDEPALDCECGATLVVTVDHSECDAQARVTVLEDPAND